MSYKPAITSMSLGRAWLHELPPKIAAARDFAGIEVFYEDLEYLARSLHDGLSDKAILEAAQEFRRLCDAQDLEIIALQPFMHYEGLLDRDEHQRRIERLQLWFRIAQILRTDTIQVPSNFLREGVTGDRETIISDFQEIADLGLKETPPIRFAYENLCWGTFINKWHQLWEIVAVVNRPNFGICLDTFHVAGGEWADPSSEDGRIKDSDAVLETSLAKMVTTIDPQRVFYVQLVDGERLDSPLKPGHPFWVDGQPARMSWSRNARVFAFEERGYMPVMKVLKAFVDPPPHGLGYTGWISLELFSRTMAESGDDIPIQHAQRAWKSWNRVVEVMGWGKMKKSGSDYCVPTRSNENGDGICSYR
ncbi:uncharacterized protein Z518_05724 [Rhinocladiella mackenziei CBS 650.93]|uniref:Xylose isomerase-like TIM barrel domain-containing protein n=1 Tax=Rhinocladiella mackenziei CBS 650.93 TaxID=1442369 RepID=A0A0D2H341_9EURO|nr:uncharacterized protein Z518_05724 [Rhinocladiella mackenziei CBS 650.93]KIX04853.1 hypothetical protein Z518_05724 [Rhinocladiella mackenziei CBS 650.93]